MRTLPGKCKAHGAVLGACGLLLAAGAAQAEITRVTAKADIAVRTLEDGEIVDEEVFSLQFPRQAAFLPVQVAVNFIPPDIPTGEDLFAALVQVYDPRENEQSRPNDFVLNAGAFTLDQMVYEVNCQARQYRELELATSEISTVRGGFLLAGALVIWATDLHSGESLEGAEASVAVRVTQQRQGVATEKRIVLKGEYVLAGTAAGGFVEHKSGALAVVDPTRINLNDIVPVIGLQNIRILVFSSELPFDFKLRPDEITRLAGYMATSLSSGEDDVGAMAVFGLPDVDVAVIIDFINRLLGSTGRVQAGAGKAKGTDHSRPLIYGPHPDRWPRPPRGPADGNRLVTP